MALILHVNSQRWRDGQERVKDRFEGIVPVIKGNGYGFGRGLLNRESQRLGVPMIAVGLYAELAESLAEFSGDVLVMEPYRSRIHGEVPEIAHQRVVHTITSTADLTDLRSRNADARVVVEGLTSMNRFGAPLGEVATLASMGGAEGVTLHLPLGSGHVSEIATFVEAAPDVTQWYVSHVTDVELAVLHSRFPGRQFHPRIGTALWLNDPTAYAVRAHVLAVRPIGRFEKAGYRQRMLPTGHLVVVSGGTSHGVAMESPAAAATARTRAIAVAEGVLEAVHHVRSPFTISGTNPRFAEPPHMQCSLLVLPEDVDAPAVGDTVPVRMRLTTAYPDEVVIT